MPKTFDLNILNAYAIESPLGRFFLSQRTRCNGEFSANQTQATASKREFHIYILFNNNMCTVDFFSDCKRPS